MLIHIEDIVAIKVQELVHLIHLCLKIRTLLVRRRHNEVQQILGDPEWLSATPNSLARFHLSLLDINLKLKLELYDVV